jgi:hypothetical protein
MRTLVDESDGKTGRHPVRPDHISLEKHFWDAFGNNETEVSAWWIVLLCQQLGGWVAFTYEQIEELYNSKGYLNFCFNRLLDGPHGFVILGADGKYRVTHEFICRCFAASPAFPAPAPSSSGIKADTAEGLLLEVAQHLQHDAGLNEGRFPGRRVGALNLALTNDALWRRIVDFLGGEPDDLTLSAVIAAIGRRRPRVNLTSFNESYEGSSVEPDPRRDDPLGCLRDHLAE